MAISDWIEKVGRTIFETPFGALEVSKDSPELAEIRLAVLDEVKARSHRVGGRDVFPYNVVRIRIRGIPEQQSELFEGGFFEQFFEQEVRGGLARANHRFPDDLSVEIETVPDLPGPKEQWLHVDAESRKKPAEAAAARRAARLIVTKGTANRAELPLSKARTNIGRTVDVYRADGPSRRNDLAFIGDDETSRTVSREHAHITFHKKSGEYRLYNDRASKTDRTCGVWIIRDGLSREVHRDARGVRLQAGDEIHLGRAVVLFK